MTRRSLARARLGLIGALVALVMLLSALPAAAGGPPPRIHPTNITWESSAQNVTWE